jgi:hypothetical protein
MNPQTIEGRFASSSTDESIQLYAGELVLAWDGQSLQGEGEIRLDWSPYPRLLFSVVCPPELGIVHIEPSISAAIEFADGTGKGSCRVWGNDVTGSTLSVTLFGSVDGDFIVGNPAPTEIVRFHVPNFPNYVGDVSYSGSDVAASRLVAHTERWHVDLNAVGNSFEVYSQLEKHGGFGITHVGLITRNDGSAVAFEDVRVLQMTLYWWLSFLRSERTGPMLFSGEHAGEVVWEIWRVPSVASWSGRRSWLPVNLLKVTTDTPDATSPIFGYILEATKEDRSFRILKRAVSWYTQSIENSYLETSVVLAQAGLELMSWLKLVDDVGISEDSVDKWNAADQFRLALYFSKISTSIPTHFTKLTDAARLAPGRDALDGPGSIAGIRNGTIHPKASSRFDDIDSVVEGSSLASRYLELLLLNRCQYLGLTRDRTNWTANDLVVPWA